MAHFSQSSIDATVTSMPAILILGHTGIRRYASP